ncbi:MAG TPA: hypothetical protein VMU07_00955 [Candidatus Paceibacterota bacterium]|nr:hypothetical protein [Candidatus Paceibacterota bacterium]
MRKFSIVLGFGVALVMACAIPVFRAHAATSTVIDPTVTTNKPSNNGTSFTNVFVSSSTGYAFYRDSTNNCVYAKTTDGGTTWGAAVTVGPSTTCIRVAVWYDRWTPGNTTGTFIHIATLETTHDDLWYDRLDTSNDSLSTILDISSSTQAGRYTAGATVGTITEGTDGHLYAGVFNTSDSYILTCSANCTASLTNWPEIGNNNAWLPDANDWMIMNPLPAGDILNIKFNIASSTLESKMWHEASSTWDANWTIIDSNCPPNTTYDGHFGTAVNHNSNFIYLVSACNIATLSANTGAIRTWTYNPTPDTWTRDTDVETSSTLGLTGAKIGLDLNTGNVYVVYSGRTTPATAATANVYYKISTSTSMSAWGSRQGPINQTTTDIYGARIDGMSASRLYATWVDVGSFTLNGTTITVFTPNTMTEAAYRFFQNQDSTQVGNTFGSTNASSLIPLAGNPFRLRMLINLAGTGIDVSGQSFKLQYATSTGGGCDTGFVGETYVDVGTATSSAISFYNNPTPANGAALTANAQDPTDGTNAIDNQTYVEQNNFSNDISKVLAGEDGKWDFSLINNSGSPGNTYCFRIVKSDGSLLDTYTNVAEAQVDQAPTISNLSLNGGQSITLIEGTTTLVVSTATVTDANGFGDFFALTGKAFRTSSGTSCTADPNDCYVATSSCGFYNCAGNSCTAECDYQFQYFAQPTDSGTPWAGDSWTALMQASDTVLSGTTATSTGVQLLSLLAFETTSTINYGSFSQGQTMSTLTATATIRSSGNVSMNVNVYGTNMTNGSFSIAVGQQHFATSALTYASGTTLLANPGSTVAINMRKPSSTANIQSSTFFWGIAIPSGQMATTYTGGNSFIGVLHSLPWPQ